MQSMCFSAEAMLRGCHGYKDVYSKKARTIGEALPCLTEQANTQDVFTVLNDGNMVCHISQKFSAACSMFLC